VKVYRYVGPRQIAERASSQPTGLPIRSSDDVREWVRSTGQELSAGCVIATFVVDITGTLMIADRRSEHVACAGQQPVLSAGEITFALGRTVEIVAVSNQSTGYCPEPESWSAVSTALAAAGLSSPGGFSLECVFRFCSTCEAKNIVKGEAFECAVCGAELPTVYNCQA
jgi:hypothetical protein